MPKSKVKDVAVHAGVSVASVSRALSGLPGVSDEVRRRVLVAARELNYQPDQVARSLRRRRTNLIGLVISTIENEFFTQIAHAAEQAAIRQGYSLLIVSTDEQIDREESSIVLLRQQLVAGIILAPAPGDVTVRSYLSATQLPIVLINRDLGDPTFSTVLADDENAVYQCVSWLIQQGRSRIGVIKGLGAITTTRERITGYKRALIDGHVTRFPDLELPGEATVEGGYRAADELMRRVDPPDAIFVHNNVMLAGAIMALQDLNIAWPDDVDVAGFGGFQRARLFRPPLTLIAQPTYMMAERAVNLLINQIDGNDGQQPQHIVLSNQLITREDWLNQREERSKWTRSSMAAKDAGRLAVVGDAGA